MKPSCIPVLHASGRALDSGPDCVGTLADCQPLLADMRSLRRHMQEEGYLYLSGYLDRDEVLSARRAVLDKLAQVGVVDPHYPVQQAAANPSYSGNEQHKLAGQIPELHTLLYTGNMMRLFERLFDRPVRRYDYTWLRVLAPGQYTQPHCDVVFMGRGTQEHLYTAWTPLGDMDAATGGLALLERSHRHQRLRDTYCRIDVDAYCSNRSSGERVKTLMGENGVLSKDPNRLRRSLGGRWLWREYQAGDVVVFNVFMVHCGLDNRTKGLRISTDSRYQPADEPIDERWNGPHPSAHGSNSKRAMIC